MKTNIRNRFLASAALFSVASAFNMGQASAAATVWIGATNATWSANTNWDTSAVPTLDDDLTILGPLNVAGELTIDISDFADANSLSFTNNAATNFTNTTSGADQMLTLQGGLTTGSGAVAIGSLTTDQRVNIDLWENQTWSIGSGGLTAKNIISGIGFGITKIGAGTLTLVGANTYTGATTINIGTLELQSAAISNFRSATTIATGATLKVTSTGPTTYTGGNYNGLALGSAFTSSKTTISGSGTLSITNALGLGNANGTGVNFAMGSGGLIDIQSDGLLVNGGFSGATWASNLASMNIASGAAFDIWDGNDVTIDALTGSGTIRNGSNSPKDARLLTVGAANGSGTFSGNITATSLGGANSQAGKIALTKVGIGTQVLSGTNTYSGATTVSGGTLELQSAAISNFRSATTIASGATLKITSTAPTTYTGGNYTGLALRSVFNGTTTIGGSGTLSISNAVGLGNASGGKSVNIAMGSGGLIDIQASSLLVNGGFQGGTWTSNLASMNIGSGAAFDIWDGNNVTIDALTGTGTIRNGSNNVTVRTLTIGAANGSGTFSGNISATNIGGLNSGAGKIAITKTGSGTQTLSGNNTYTGDTTVSDGILAVGGSAIADTNKLIVTGGKVAPTGTEVVNTLYFGPAQQASGTWGATGSGATHIDDKHFSGTDGVVSVITGPPGYPGWAASEGLTIGVNDGSNQDPDGDGIVNLLEYVFGGHPIGVSAADTSILPTQSLDATNVILTFNRSDLSEIDTTQTVQISVDLDTWTDFTTIVVASAGAVTVTEGTDPVADTVSVAIPRSNELNGKLFVRINVTKN